MAESSIVWITLIVDKKSSKLLFAEADKDFVDFLITLFALPLGTVTWLLKQNDNDMPGSLGVLHESIQSLSSPYILSHVSMEAMLRTEVILSSNDRIGPLLKNDGVNPGDGKLYRCSSCSHRTNVVIDPSGASQIGGYVDGVATYIVMDDLAVKPIYSISSFTSLNTFNIKDLGGIEEKSVSIGMSEGLKLLRASLHSKTVLTDVFLRGA